MPKIRKPAEVFCPGEFLRDELEARGWTQHDLSRVIGRPLQSVNQIINGRKSITAQTAMELASALGTSPQVWLNLQAAWDLSRVKRTDPMIVKRARMLRCA